MNRQTLSYITTAFAILLLAHALLIRHTAPAANILLSVSIAISLLAGSLPRLIDLPIHYAAPLRTIEYFTFLIAAICFIALALRHFF